MSHNGTYITFGLLIIVTHYTFLLVQHIFKLTAAQTLFYCYMIFYHAFYWVTSLIYEYMDQGGVSKEFYKKYKLKIKPSNITFLQMVPCVVFNQILQATFIYVVIKFFWIGEEEKPSLLNTFKWLLIFYIVYDIIFYFGHLIMHKSRWLYTKIHHKHHSVFASKGVSAHYMTPWDFLLESLLEALIMLLLCARFGASRVAFLCFAIVGALNTIVVHSGFDLPWLPSPRSHYAHHVYYHVNYSIGPLDTLFGTRDDGQNIKMEDGH